MQESTDVLSIIDTISDLDAIGFAVGFIWALYTGRLVFGSDCRADTDRERNHKEEYKKIVDLYHESLEIKVKNLEDKGKVL